jgi:energy-coupling factor transporter ATP-binding protein EcfA2
MRWITGITINNYRAFSKPETISIPQGQHLLIYGENGSGKSSIYNALKDFFSSSFPLPAFEFKLNAFEKAMHNTNGAVTIKIAEEDANGHTLENDYTFSAPDSNSTHRQKQIQLANKIKGFLDYKKLIKIHALNVPADTRPNMFDVIVKDLLCEHRIANLKGGATTDELLEEYNRLAKILLVTPIHYGIYKTARDELRKLDAALFTLLGQIIEKTNKYLNEYFKNKVNVTIEYHNLEIYKPSPSQKRQMREELPLIVQYAGLEIAHYQAFLNEARLSALAVCLYLASIKTNPLMASDLRLLFLDDVFIGLDTSNRIPLLEILRDEFIKEDFQIFISTYDRHWFELARQWFDNNNCKFKTLEMYVEDDGNPNTLERPVLIDKSSGHFENAKRHFDAKDYPTAANYLRKACEKELRRILPGNKTLITNHNTGEVKKIDKLEILINNFLEYAAKNGLDCGPFRHFKTYKKIILNPLSHDDLEAPHYRREIQAGIDLVQSLQKIKVKDIVKAEDSAKKTMKLGVKDTVSGVMHQYEITVLENLRIIQQNTGPVKLSSVECAVDDRTSKRPFVSMTEALEAIWIERSYTGQTDYAEFYKNIKITNSKRLCDYMVF